MKIQQSVRRPLAEPASLAPRVAMSPFLDERLPSLDQFLTAHTLRGLFVARDCIFVASRCSEDFRPSADFVGDGPVGCDQMFRSGCTRNCLRPARIRPRRVPLRSSLAKDAYQLDLQNGVRRQGGTVDGGGRDNTVRRFRCSSCSGDTVVARCAGG